MRSLGFSACTQVFSSLLDLGVQRASNGQLPVLEKPCGNVGLKQCSPAPPPPLSFILRSQGYSGCSLWHEVDEEGEAHEPTTSKEGNFN